MRTYIECCRRKGKPKIAIEVCRTCRYNQKCSAYLSYRNPELFDNMGKPLRNSAP